jgi:hypothetical protein
MVYCVRPAGCQRDGGAALQTPCFKPHKRIKVDEISVFAFMEASIVYTNINTHNSSSAHKNLTPSRERNGRYTARGALEQQRVLVGTALYLVFCLFMLYSAA